MKDSKDLLSSILKTAQMGQVGIRAVMKADIDQNLKHALTHQLEEYAQIEQEAYLLAKTERLQTQSLHPIAKRMARMTTKARLSYGNVSSKTAAMMIQGNTRGMIKSLKNLNHYDHSNQKVALLAEKLLKYEENNVQQMQGFV